MECYLRRWTPGLFLEEPESRPGRHPRQFALARAGDYVNGTHRFRTDSLCFTSPASRSCFGLLVLLLLPAGPAQAQYA